MPRWPGYVISEETKKKIGAANKGRVLPSPTPETIAKRVASRAGYRHSEEAKKKIGNSNRGNIFSPEICAKFSEQRKGRAIPEETKTKISVALKGKRKSEEHVAKVAAAQRGQKRKPCSVEAKQHLSTLFKGKPRPPEVLDRIMANWSHGKRVDHNGTVYRSTWEVRFAKACEVRGVVFEYEKRRFDLGTCTYLPDFYLPRTGAYWEVKGWLGPDSQKKIALFREQFPEIPLVVATKPILIAWEKSCNVNTHYL